jgi:hypothetical protein
MSNPANRTALREELNDRPDAVDGVGEGPGAAQMPGRVHQPPAQLIEVILEQVEYVAGHVDLDLSCRRQVRGRQLGQPVPARPIAHPAVAHHRGALVEQHGLDALHPGRVLPPQVVLALQQRPTLQHVAGWDPTLGDPSRRE